MFKDSMVRFHGPFGAFRLIGCTNEEKVGNCFWVLALFTIAGWMEAETVEVTVKPAMSGA